MLTRKSLSRQLFVLILFIPAATVCKAQHPAEKLQGTSKAHSQQSMSNSGQSTDVNKLIQIDQSGDANISIPLINIQSRKLSLPITANYSPGIKVDQKSSEIGLGWNISFGSIVRDYGAFEPDYADTSVETKMQNTVSGTSNDLSVNGVTINTNHRQKFLTYEGPSGTDTEKMTPDIYRVNIPGIGSNHFWNDGNEGASHDFKWGEFQAWRVEHNTKVFEIDQEISRINEVNAAFHSSQSQPQIKTAFVENTSHAAAIAVPPYVSDRYFKPLSPAPTTTLVSYDVPTGDNQKVRYRDFEKFTITSEDGTQYVFGRALRGQKYLFTEDPYWSVVGNEAHKDHINSLSGKVFGELWKIDFIAEWLLTEVRSYDYIDANGNSIADEGDAGDWIRIEYTAPTQVVTVKNEAAGDYEYEVPRHREWMNFSSTDPASSLMRERAYVTRIITPTQEINFNKSPRFDVDHDYFQEPLNIVKGAHHTQKHAYSKLPLGTNGSNSDFNIHYPVEMMKYDKIVIRDRLSNQALNTIVFDYASKGSNQELAVSEYLIRDNNNLEMIPFDPEVTAGPPLSSFDIEDYNIQNSGYGAGRGKTTLLGINFYPGDNTSSLDSRKYSFDYNYNPSYSDIHKFQILKSNAYADLRNSYPVEERTKHEDLGTSLLPYLAIQYGCNTVSVAAGEPDQLFPNTHALKDEMGYYNDPNITTFGALDGRNAWSLTEITIPEGGKVSLEYEKDEFEYGVDQNGWYTNGSLVDDRLPFINNYNRLAITKNIMQCNYNTMVANPSKELNMVFSMPMNQYSGGLRLKRKTMDDGVNQPVIVNYEYGSGHYTSVPASYWNNYLNAFTAFMQHERSRQEHESSYDPTLLSWFNVWELDDSGQPILIYDDGYIDENDFDTHISALAINVRTDHTLKDELFYEYVDEVYPNGSKIRRKYGHIDGSSLTYDVQKTAYLKGDAYDKKNYVELITNEVNKAKDISLLATEHFEAGSGTPYQSSSFNFSATEKEGRANNFKSFSLTPFAHRVYYYANGLLRHANRALGGEIVFDMSSVPMINGPGTINNMVSQLYNKINQQGLFYNSSNPSSFSPPDYIDDNDYTIAALNNHKRYQSIWKRLNSQTDTYEGLPSITQYTYESTYGLLRSTLVKNSSQYDGPTQISDRNQITEITYAHEAYPSHPATGTNVFLDKNMLSQGAETIEYVQFISPANVISASAQTWLYDLDRQVYFPYKTYQYVDEATSNPLNIGGAVNGFTSYFSGSNSHWIEIAHTSNYDHYGISEVSFAKGVYNRIIPGYGSKISKAEFSWDQDWFDAAYTGFEDLEVGKSLVYSNDVYAYSYTAITPFCSPPNCGISANAAIFIDDPNAFQVGDIIQIWVNRDLPSNGVTGSHLSLTNDLILESTVCEITHYPNITNNTANYFLSVYGIDFTLHKYALCLEDQITGIPGVSINSGNIFRGAIIRKKNNQAVTYQYNEDLPEVWVEDINPPHKGTTTDQVHSGELSYYLENKLLSGDPSAQSPIHSVYIQSCSQQGQGGGSQTPAAPGSGGTPALGCQVEYIAGVWIKTNMFGGPISGSGSLHYTLWNSDKSSIVSSGSIPLANYHSSWTYYELTIAVDRPSSGYRLLDVWVQSDVVAAAQEHIYYIDDLLVYPEGAKYEFRSHNIFGNPTDVTNTNDDHFKSTYDEWGRPGSSFNAEGELISQQDYHTGKIGSFIANYMDNTTYIDDNSFNQTRSFTDGLGKAIQTIIREPARGILSVNNHIEYDNMGRPVKTYQPIPLVGSGIPLIPFQSALIQTKSQYTYQSSYSYNEVQYLMEPGSRISSQSTPREDAESPITNLLDKSLVSGSVTVSNSFDFLPGQLLKSKTTDAHGNNHTSFTDKFGNVVLQKEPIGYSYSENVNGQTVFDLNSTFEYAYTHFTYDGANRLIKVTDPDGYLTTYEYNSIGQLIKENNPAKGITEYRYDDFGRLRFVQSQKDKDAITNATLTDQFTYYKYDSWGREIEAGVIKLPLGTTAVFNTTASVNNYLFPDDTQIGVEIHHKFTFDGTKADHAVDRLIKEEVFSEHSFNSVSQRYDAAHTDITEFTYTANGEVATKKYTLSGLQGVHLFSYDYNRAGLPEKTSYSNSIKTAYNWVVNNEYDDLGRLIKSSSGTAENSTTEDAVYEYDGIGNLLKTRLGATGNSNDPYLEYITSNYNIRGQQTYQLAKNFRYELQYDQLGNITRQRWSNDYWDNTSGFNLNQYRYNYDAMNRLVGANYSNVVLYDNPYLNYGSNAILTPSVLVCTPITTTDMANSNSTANLFLSSLDPEGENAILAGGQIQDVLEIIEQQMLQAGTNFGSLSSEQQDNIIQQILTATNEIEVNLNQLEEIYIGSLGQSLLDYLHELNMDSEGSVPPATQTDITNYIAYLNSVVENFSTPFKDMEEESRNTHLNNAISEATGNNLNAPDVEILALYFENGLDQIILSASDQLKHELQQDHLAAGNALSPEFNTTVDNYIADVEALLLDITQPYTLLSNGEQQQLLADAQTLADNAELIINDQQILVDFFTWQSRGELTAENLVLTKQLLEQVQIIILQNCEINRDALAIKTLNPVSNVKSIVKGRIYDAAYDYHYNGNMIQLERYDHNTVKQVQDYSYGTNNRLAHVQWNTGGVVSQNNYTYDANGNLTADARAAVSQISYTNFHNLPLSITNGSGVNKYRYDIRGQRSAKELPSGDKEFFMEGLVLSANGKPKRLTVVQGYAVLDPSDVVQKSYTISDWLGTVRITITSGNISSTRDHYPFGLLMPQRVYASDVEGQRLQFTGHHFDGETTYGYHGARYYNRELGRYMSVDPLASSFPAWTSYHYVHANPIGFIDPTGKKAEPVYDLEGNHLGNTEDRFTGEILIYSGNRKVEFSKMSLKDAKALDGMSTLNIRATNISDKAFSKIMTDIIEHFNGTEIFHNVNFDFDQVGGKIHTGDFDPRDEFYYDDNKIYAVKNPALMDYTVENVQTAIIAHEYYGHHVVRREDKWGNHRYAFMYEMKYIHRHNLSVTSRFYNQTISWLRGHIESDFDLDITKPSDRARLEAEFGRLRKTWEK